MGGEAGQSGEREETGGYLERAGPGVVMDDRDLICVRVLICDAVGFGDLERRFRENATSAAQGALAEARVEQIAPQRRRKSSILQHRRSSISSVLNQCVQIPR